MVTPTSSEAIARLSFKPQTYSFRCYEMVEADAHIHPAEQREKTPALQGGNEMLAVAKAWYEENELWRFWRQNSQRIPNLH